MESVEAVQVLERLDLNVPKRDASRVCLQSDESWNCVCRWKSAVWMREIGAGNEGEVGNVHTVETHLVILALHGDFVGIPFTYGFNWRASRHYAAL
jgi:hypothetical protein